MKAFKAVLFAIIVLSLTLSALAQGSGKVVKVSAGESVYKIKRGASVVSGASGSAADVIEARCRRVGAPIWLLGRDIEYRIRTMSRSGTVFDMSIADESMRALTSAPFATSTLTRSVRTAGLRR